MILILSDYVLRNEALWSSTNSIQAIVTFDDNINTIKTSLTQQNKVL